MHSSESVGVAIDIVESMLKQHCSLAELSDVFLPEACQYHLREPCARSTF